MLPFDIIIYTILRHVERGGPLDERTLRSTTQKKKKTRKRKEEKRERGFQGVRKGDLSIDFLFLKIRNDL